MTHGIQQAFFQDRDETDFSPSYGVAPLCVRRLSVFSFRNYRDVRLDVTGEPVVLTGANGSGKTNLLEAISLLVPGRGLRRARADELQNRQDTESWAVVAELDTPRGPMKFGTGWEKDGRDNDKRVVHIDGKAAKNQQMLAEHIAMAWITPELDRVLVESPSARRKFLDRLACSFDPAHGGRVLRYEKAMRERMRLLREGPRDPAWLSVLEDEMARTGVAIAAARRLLIQQLQSAIEETASVFPQAVLGLCGLAEEGLADQPALMVEDRLRDALARGRDDDAQAGMTNAGPHRSDLTVLHRARNCPADLCSTGEQKALLIAIMLAYVRVLTRARGMTPLLLLDDIAAHLDALRRGALFEEIRALQVQAWLTGTDPSFFTPLLPFAQSFSVDQGFVFGAFEG